ncbi:MAG TPA: hypothetical protein VKG91_04600 [Roseiarcus sp.]|nr:hypothetical protein [Roseiarcus sp.]
MRQANRLSESTKRPPFRWHAELLSRLSGPGGLYNLRDALGFGAGLLIAYLGWWETANAVDNVFSIGMRYVAGSPAAVALTIATAIFFGSGEAYHRAWANGFPPDTKLTQIGDLFSGFGAIALGVGLYLLGNPVLAATSGLLHAAGKFGSALNTRGKLSIAGRSIDASTFCRIVVLISRAPALIAISADILSSRARDDGSFAFISLVMTTFSRDCFAQAWLGKSALSRNLPCASKSQPCVSASPQYSY